MTAQELVADRSARLRRLLPSLAINVATPALAYVVSRPFVGTDTIALLIGVTVPVVATLVEFLVRQKVDRIGVLSVLAFAVLIGLLLVTGGDPLILKLHEAVFTGPLGVIALGSIAVGKPMAGLVKALRNSMSRHELSVLTAVAGGTLIIHCAVLLGLALVLPTSTYLTLGRLAGASVIIAGGFAVRAYWIRRARTHVTDAMN